MGFYQHHIFCCTNTREPGHRRGSCGEKGADELRAYMKAKAKELGIEGARVNSAGCLDRCEQGPCVVVYPAGTWYKVTSKAEVDAVLSAIKEGKVAEGLTI